MAKKATIIEPLKHQTRRFERELIGRVLPSFRRLEDAARALGITRETLRKKLNAK